MKTLRVPLLLFAVPAALAALAPTFCVYDRAAILGGAWWRLVTGHWVHFSVSHAAWNLLVLLVAGAWLERERPGVMLRFTALASPLIGLGLLAFAPTMAFYGGLSGLAVGLVTLLVVVRLAADEAGRAWWFAALALLAAKFAYEAAAGAALFVRWEQVDVRPSFAAHVLGAAAAVLFHQMARARRSDPLNSAARPALIPARSPAGRR